MRRNGSRVVCSAVGHEIIEIFTKFNVTKCDLDKIESVWPSRLRTSEYWIILCLFVHVRVCSVCSCGHMT